MEWRIRIHRKALKFLEKLQEHERKRIVEKLVNLVESLERGFLPYARLDVKKLKGKWEGFLRLRVGNIRIIFKIDVDRKEVFIYHIHYRGHIYQ